MLNNLAYLILNITLWECKSSYLKCLSLNTVYAYALHLIKKYSYHASIWKYEKYNDDALILLRALTTNATNFDGVSSVL